MSEVDMYNMAASQVLMRQACYSSNCYLSFVYAKVDTDQPTHAFGDPDKLYSLWTVDL